MANTLQSLVDKDRDAWLELVRQEQAKTNAAGVQGYTGYQDMMNNVGKAGTYDTSGRFGDGSRVVAPGTSGYDEWVMSDQDYAQLQQYKQNYANATTQAERDAAHNAAEVLRARYNYSGGSDGSMYLNAAPQDYSLLYGIPEEQTVVGGYGLGGVGGGGYNSQYGSQIDAMLNALLNREPFSYNKDDDPLYQQYKESYTRAGNRAMQDVLAQVSARTGGIASSYGTSASQQAYNNYMAELADKVPELYQLAYSMYMDDIAQDRADLDTLLGIDNMYYDRYRDTVGDSQWQQTFDYNASRDQVADSQWQQQFNYGVNSDMQKLAQSQIDAILKAGGTPSAELVAQAGYSNDYVNSMGNYYRRSATPGYTPVEPADMDYEGLFASAWASEDPASYISNKAKKHGFTSTTGLKDAYDEWLNTDFNGQTMYQQMDFDTLTSYTNHLINAGTKYQKDPGDYAYDILHNQGYSDAVIDKVFAKLGL